MRVAYLVITHRNPRLLQKAIEKLSSEDWSFFIHVDQKADAREFSEIAGDNILFTRTRIPVYWGEFSQVQAAVLLMRQALECHPPCDWLLLSTGSDYPLRSREYIHAFLEESRGLEFMSMVKMPAPGKPILRINLVRFPSTQPIRRFASRALAKAGLARRDHRKHLRGMDPFSGEGC